MIQVECLNESALDEVLALEQICFPKDPWSRPSFENELHNPLSCFLTAKSEKTGKIIGYGGVWFLYDVGNITKLAVHPEYRRERIGRQLLDALISACQGRKMTAVTLEVRQSNLAAQKLYASEGFISCGIRKRYYQGTEDAVIMTKEWNLTNE